MKVKLYGKKRADVMWDGFELKTDQPVHAGGEGTAPDPFSFFLGSLAACAGVYIKGFCDQRNLDSSNIEIEQDIEYDQKKRMISKVILRVNVPADFPSKYDKALINAAGLCAVKRHLKEEIGFEGMVVRQEVLHTV